MVKEIQEETLDEDLWNHNINIGRNILFFSLSFPSSYSCLFILFSFTESFLHRAIVYLSSVMTVSMPPTNVNMNTVPLSPAESANGHLECKAMATATVGDVSGSGRGNEDISGDGSISGDGNIHGVGSISGNGSIHGVENTSANPATTPAVKKRKVTNELAQLLTSAEWYTQTFRGSRVRESSLKFQKQKDLKIQEMIRGDKEVTMTTHTLETPEEIAEKERIRKERAEKMKAKAEERKKEKELKRLKALERKRLIEQGVIKPHRVKSKSKQDAVGEINLDPNELKSSKNYYGGGHLAELLKASSYYTNLGSQFDGSRRKVRPVERLNEDKEYLNELNRKSKGKRLLKNKAADHPKLKRLKTVDNTTMRRHTKKVANIKAEEGEKEEVDKLEKETKEEEETRDEVTQREPEPIWFINLNENKNDIEINDTRSFFQSFVYDKQNDSQIPSDIVSAADLVKRRIKTYRTDHEVYKLQRVQLHFPFSEYKEDYILALPKDELQFNPFDEIGKNMEILSTQFFPPDESVKVVNLQDPENCIVGKYIKAFDDNDLDLLLKCIDEFNNLIDELRNNGKILDHVINKKAFSICVIYELLNQCYLRRVLPDSKKLSNYKAFSNEVYGELMPAFLSSVYRACNLNSRSCFIDLGSGVGNCVIQASLEFGCESYGVEIVEHASRLGDLQLAEFNNRCRVLGLNPGITKLFSQQSFIDNPPVKAVVDRCDVILCNNYLFDANLNKKVIDLFQDLKVGCKIISLKPIVPAGHRLDGNNINSILNKMKTSKFIYEENSVSWTSKGGFYYITEVMDTMDEALFRIRATRSRREDSIDERTRSNTPLNAFTNNV